MRKFLKGLGWTLGVLILIALLLRIFLLKTWTVPDDPVLSASVAPSLSGGDVVLVWTRGSRRFGDLVLCPDPEVPSSYVVARIAGLEGDVVETDGPLLQVNGVRYDSDSACTESHMTIKHPTTGVDVKISCDVVSMGGGSHLRGISAKGPLERPMRTQVTPGQIFLLSDNRNFHYDSRDYGLQPYAACKQKVFFRLWGKESWMEDERRMTYVR